MGCRMGWDGMGWRLVASDGSCPVNGRAVRGQGLKRCEVGFSQVVGSVDACADVALTDLRGCGVWPWKGWTCKS